MFFKNRNWLKVLVPQAVMTVLTLAVFFGCWWLGVRDKATFVAAFFVAFAISTITIIITSALSTSIAFVASTTAAVPSLFGVAAAFASIKSSTIAVSIFATAIAFTVLAFLILVIVIVVSEEYKLPWNKVVLSYLAQGAIVFFPICLTLTLAS